MPSTSDIREQKAGPVQETADGFTHTRRWKCIARSEMEARAKMRHFAGVFISAPWYTTFGEKPDPSVVCRSLSIEGSPPAPLGGQGDYLVEAGYEPAGTDEAVIGGPPKYRIQTSITSVPVDIDADGDPIENSAGQPIDPPLTDQDDQEVLVVEWWRKYATLSACFAEIRPYRNAKNLTAWQAAPKGSVRCRGIANVDEVEVEDGLWVKLRSPFEYREPIDTATFPAVVKDKSGATQAGTLEGFDTLSADRGTRVKGAVVDGVQTYLPIMTEDGTEPVREPVNLDGLGQALGSSATPVAIVRRLSAKYLDFSALGI